MTGELAVLFSHRGFSFTGSGGFMVLQGGGTFSAMVGGVELVCRRCPILERRARNNNRSWARISSSLALRFRILYDILRSPISIGRYGR